MHYIKHYASVSEMIASCTDAWELKHRFHGDTSTESLQRESFIGRKFSDWEDIVEACKHAKQEDLQTIQGMMNEIAGADVPSPTNRKRRRIRSEDGGDDIDYDRLHGGESEFWIDTIRKQVSGTQTLTIMVNVAGSRDVPFNDLFWRGAAAVALADKLENAGYRVEIIAASLLTHLYMKRKNSKRGEGYSFISTRLKEAQDPLDIDALAVATSGWFFRSVHFQGHAVCGKPLIEHIGYPCHLRETDSKVQEAVGHGSRLISLDDIFDKKSAVDFIKKTLMEIEA